MGHFRLQWTLTVQAQRPGGRQAGSLAQGIVQKQAGPQHPARTQVRPMGQHETQRPDDVRCLRQQHLPLRQCFTYQAKLVVLEITQSSVNQLAAPGGCVRCQIVLLAQTDRQPTTCGIHRNTDTIYATTDYQQVEGLALLRKDTLLPAIRARLEQLNLSMMGFRLD